MNVTKQQAEEVLGQVEQVQRDVRDRASYAVVGPMLRAYKEGEAPPEFEDYWDELSEFRNGIPGLIDELREQARHRVAHGEDRARLDYPEFAPFSWDLPGT